MDLLEIKKYIVATPLQLIGLGPDNAVAQVFYTGFLESKYEHLRQVHGPALSPFQIEPETHLSVKTWLSNGFNRGLLERVLNACSMRQLPPDEALMTNWGYAAIICRLIYYRSKRPLPDAKDAAGIAGTHKIVYNTRFGKADPVVNTRIIQDLIARGL